MEFGIWKTLADTTIKLPRWKDSMHGVVLGAYSPYCYHSQAFWEYVTINSKVVLVHLATRAGSWMGGIVRECSGGPGGGRAGLH